MIHKTSAFLVTSILTLIYSDERRHLMGQIVGPRLSTITPYPLIFTKIDMDVLERA